jgi:hypothetical protein
MTCSTRSSAIIRVDVRRTVLLLALFCSLVAPSAVAAPTAREEGSQIASSHPDWALPAWTHGGPATWTMVGAPYAASVALVGGDGSLAPRNHGPSLDLWLYDVDAGRLLVPSDFAPALHLDDGWAPIVTTEWHAGDLTVQTTVFAGWTVGDVNYWFATHGLGSDQAVTFIRTTVSTSSQASRHLLSYVALRPYGVEPDIHPIGVATCDRQSGSLAADGRLVVTSLQPVDACGASAADTLDVATYASRGQTPDVASVSASAQRAEAILQTSINTLSGTPAVLEYRAPLGPAGADVQPKTASFDAERSEVLNAWRQATSRVTLDLSDTRLTNAFRASETYLLLNRRGPWPRSGPLAHDASWIRDATYVGQALDRMGYGAENQATLDAYVTRQRDDGSIPAIVDSSGARDVQELDSDGEAIAAAVQHYRFTADRTSLANEYPALLRAAQHLEGLQQAPPPDTPELRDLLPANLSAEDLGDAGVHHYWDDFWALAGFREAAFAAGELGHSDDAAALSSRADTLQAALLQSIQNVDARTGIAYVPNGPEDVESSAMARGTTPALWPIAAFQGTQVQPLLRRSFDSYFTTWLAPQGGGYQHYQGTLWPYGGLGIAHAMLRLGMLDQVSEIVAWTLGHQTLPGTYAWGEAVNPASGGLELGDMPHSWAAAELISLLRDMVLTEQNGALLVNGGAPAGWLDPGNHILLRNAPTYYGRVSIDLQRYSSDLLVSLSGKPPLGWRVRIPPNAQHLVVDGVSQPAPSGDVVHVPSGTHMLRIIYAM